MLQSNDYRVEILYQEKQGLRSRTVKVRDVVDLSEGTFELEDDDLGEAPLLIGDVEIDNGRIFMDLTVCAIGGDDCDSIAERRVRFVQGSRERVTGETRSGVYYRITFRPN